MHSLCIPNIINVQYMIKLYIFVTMVYYYNYHNSAYYPPSYILFKNTVF
jgi:hypothetical protein